MIMTPSSLVKIYTHVKGTKFCSDILIENGKVQIAVVGGKLSLEKKKSKNKKKFTHTHTNKQTNHNPN